MHRGERDLGGAGEEEAVLLELVDVRLLGREEARSDHRLLADEHGRQHRREPGRARRGRARSGRARARAAPCRRRCSRTAIRRGARRARARSGRSRSPPSTSASVGRLAEAADLDGVVLGVAVGRGLVRRVRDERERLVAGGLGGGELLLGRPQLLLHPLQLLELLGRRLALQLRPAAEIVDARHERAPALVGREQRVERLGRALAGERGAPDVGLGAGCLEVDHASESRYASITVATPSSFGARADPVGALEQQRVRVLDRDPEAGLARSARCRSRRPRTRRSRSSEMPSCCATNAIPVPFDTAGLPSSSRYGSEVVRKRRSPNAAASASRRAGISAGSATATSFVGGCVEPRREVADLLDREVLEVGVHPRVLRVLGRRRGGRRRSSSAGTRARSSSAIASRAVSSGIGSWSTNVAARRVDDRGALVTDDGVGDARLLEIGPHRAEHPARRHDHRDPGRLRAGDRRAGARAQQPVAADERAVEVAGECLDVAREGGWEDQPPVACVDVRSDVRDLLVGELAGERRHRAHALRDAGHDELGVRLGVVEIRPDGAGRAGVGERVAADAAGAREDGLAGGRVARERRARAGRSCPSSRSAACRRRSPRWRVVSVPSRQPAPSRPSASASRDEANDRGPAHHGGSLTRLAELA